MEGDGVGVNSDGAWLFGAVENIMAMRDDGRINLR